MSIHVIIQLDRIDISAICAVKVIELGLSVRVVSGSLCCPDLRAFAAISIKGLLVYFFAFSLAHNTTADAPSAMVDVM